MPRGKSTTPVARGRAVRLRGELNDAERRMWGLLRDRRLARYKFRRQHPIGPYIADFACLEYGLVVEIDGGQHARQRDYDAARDRMLREAGFLTIRIPADLPLRDREAALGTILGALLARDRDGR
jgi:very-short-patch-repair endonuclease